MRYTQEQMVEQTLRDRYVVERELGRGAGGTTYLATDRASGQQVVMKQLRLKDAREWKAVDLFEREAQVLRGLDHPCIPKLVDSFSDETGDVAFYLVREYLPGLTLAEHVASGQRMTDTSVRRVGLEALDLLEYLHGLRPPVIHRDIKPENLLLREGTGDVCLLDFGGVQAVKRGGRNSSTVVGTYGYMPPEQFLGQACPASDLYALGATLLFALTGTTPSELPRQGLRVDLDGVIPADSTLGVALGALLEPDVERRPADVAQARALLRGERRVRLSPRTRRRTLERPHGSRVRSEERSDGGLTVHVPAAGGLRAIVRLAATSWGLLIALLFTFTVVGALFGLPLVWVFARRLYHQSRMYFQAVTLDLSRDELTLERSYAGVLGLLFSQVVRIPVGEIQGLTVRERFADRRRGLPASGCAVERGVDALWFAEALTDVERAWIAQVLGERLLAFGAPLLVGQVLAHPALAGRRE
jgi:eukaryotic-like serine/threonine-protein kinase